MITDISMIFCGQFYEFIICMEVHWKMKCLYYIDNKVSYSCRNELSKDIFQLQL